MEKKVSTRIEGSNDGPQITSANPEERILARRLRIQKRNAAARKRLLTVVDGKELSKDEETVLEQQVEKSAVELLTLTDEGKELISNVRIAADSHEVKRRCDQAAAKDARIRKLEEEANIAQNKFEVINNKWENIATLNDPLDLHKETEMQREKCVDLIAQKDQLIADLKAELKSGDERFVKDQQKQADDISLLVERIDNQIAVMRRAYRRELILIEQAIDIERKEMMEVNNKKWETLYKQREEDEINNLEKRFVALSEHNQRMQSILVHHQEKFRATKISLERDIQILQQQLEQVKAVCLLNKEKMEYNYQVLKKRDEESLLIRSQQKRRINKLQDIVTTLRRKILAMEQSTQAEVKRLTSEVLKLHRNIKDIQVKAEHFYSVNESKYFQLWKFNHDSAQKLLDKILSIDRLIYEQQLGIEWVPRPSAPILKKDLRSYKAAVEDQMDLAEMGQSRSALSSELSKERLLQRILQAVADRSGFLVEDRLNILLAPYTRSQHTLVRIDNVFNALGVSRQEDMDLLRETMEPYIVCVTCQPILEAVHPVSPPAIPPPLTLTEEELHSRLTRKITDTLEEGEKAALLLKEKKSPLKDERATEDLLCLDITPYDSVTGEESAMAPWVGLGTLEMTQRSFLSSTPASSSHIKSPVHFSTPTIPISTGLVESNPPSLEDTEPERPSLLELQQQDDEQEEEKLKVQVTKSRHNPSHEQTINPVFVLKALREFVQKFQAMKHGDNNVGLGKKNESSKSISRKITDADVKLYWRQFRSAFPPEKEKLWDCLYMGLQKYHSMLQERHKMNNEIEQLKVQNTDLRRLLQKYATPNNMKAARGVKYNLPPISAKTPATPAPTPARLVLSFNNSSRV